MDPTAAQGPQGDGALDARSQPGPTEDALDASGAQARAPGVEEEGPVGGIVGQTSPGRELGALLLQVPPQRVGRGSTELGRAGTGRPGPQEDTVSGDVGQAEGKQFVHPAARGGQEGERAPVAPGERRATLGSGQEPFQLLGREEGGCLPDHPGMGDAFGGIMSETPGSILPEEAEERAKACQVAGDGRRAERSFGRQVRQVGSHVRAHDRLGGSDMGIGTPICQEPAEAAQVPLVSPERVGAASPVQAQVDEEVRDRVDHGPAPCPRERVDAQDRSSQGNRLLDAPPRDDLQDGEKWYSLPGARFLPGRIPPCRLEGYHPDGANVTPAWRRRPATRSPRA